MPQRGQRAQRHLNGERLPVDGVHNGLREAVLLRVEAQTFAGEVVLVVEVQRDVLLTGEILPDGGIGVVARAGVADAAVQRHQPVLHVELLHIDVAVHGGIAPDLLGGQGAAVEAQGAVGGAERLVAHVPDEQIVRAHGGGAVAGGGARSVDVEHNLAAHLIGDGDKGVLQDGQTVLHGRSLSGADRRPLELQHVVGVAAEQGEIIIVAVHESIVGVTDRGKGAEADFHREGASVDDAAHLLREVLLGGFQRQSFRGEAGFCVCPDGHVVPADQILPDR